MNRSILLQKQEEEKAIFPIIALEGGDIEFEHIGERHEPDFKLRYNGKRIGLEVVTLHPYKNHRFNVPAEVENFVSDYIHEKYQYQDCPEFSCISIALGPKLLYSSGKLKNTPEVKTAIENAINRNIDYDYFAEFRLTDLTKDITVDAEYLHSLTHLASQYGQKFPIVSFDNPGGMQSPVSENDINVALSLKEEKYNRYTSHNGVQFDEVWLCMALPDEEYGFSIKGAPIPIIDSKFDRIYLTQTTIPFARLIYNRNEYE